MDDAPIELHVEYAELPAEQVAVWRAGILLLLQIVMDAEEKSELHEYLVAVGDRGAGRGVSPLRPVEVVSEGT